MNSRLKSHHAKAEQARETHTYLVEGASILFTKDVVSFIKSSDLTRSALAERIGSPPAFITKILSNVANFTLESMVIFANPIKK